MTWRTIVLTKNSEISLRLDHLVIKSDQVVTVPLAEIGQVVIENPNIVMTGHILNALSKHKIMTIICDKRHIPYTNINLIHGHFRQVKVIKQQIQWTIEDKGKLWQKVIQHKIQNQKSVLTQFYEAKALTNFNRYIADVEIADETNREGHAAKVYFNKLFGPTFIRGEDSLHNWALNYGYSLLLALFTRTLITKGLLTEIGIHHHSQYNFYNLASDFMEVYRPLVDYIVKLTIVDEFDHDARIELLDMFN